MLWTLWSVSVCLTQVGILLKMAKRGMTQTTPHGWPVTRFLSPYIAAKFDRGQPVQGRQTQVEWVKIGDFRQITRYISKTVQDRHMVSIEVE